MIEAITAAEAALRDMVIGFLRGYTGPPDVAADELIRMVRQWDAQMEGAARRPLKAGAGAGETASDALEDTSTTSTKGRSS